MARSAGTLAVAITANSTRFERSLARAQMSVKSFAAAARSAMAGFGVAMGGAAIIGAAKKFVDNLDQIGKSADKLGISTDRFQMLEYAAAQTGTAIGQVTGAMQRLNAVYGRAVAGDKSAAGTFRLLGLELDKLKGLRPDELFDEVATALNTMQDPAARNVAITEAFGRSGQELNNFLRDYIALGAQAKERGLITGENEIRAAERLNDQLDNLTRTLKKIITDLGIISKLSEAIDVIGDKKSNFWGHLGAEAYNLFTNANPVTLGYQLYNVANGGEWRDWAAEDGIRPDDKQKTGPITRAEVENALNERAARAEAREREAERARRTRAEMERRLAENPQNIEKAAKTAAAPKTPDAQTTGSFSIRDLAMMVVASSPQERTAKATETLVDNAKEQTQLQKEIKGALEEDYSNITSVYT